MNLKKKLATKILSLKDKFSQQRGKGRAKSDTQIFNHPRRDRALRSGKK